MILLVDNYDSFTYNLAQLFPGRKLTILRNDDPDLYEVANVAKAIVFSPGPGVPSEAGEMENLIRNFYQTKPMLGICLGHQAIGEVFGGQIIQAPAVLHGKVSELYHKGCGLFAGLPERFEVMRDQSLLLNSLPLKLEVHGCSDGLIMAIKHRDYPIFGLQFHPESIGSQFGQELIKNFITVLEEVK